MTSMKDFTVYKVYIFASAYVHLTMLLNSWDVSDLINGKGITE